MAYIYKEYCEVCKCETYFYNNSGCGVCSEKKLKEQERMWEAQDPDTKMTNLRKRIEHLEQGPARF